MKALLAACLVVLLSGPRPAIAQESAGPSGLVDGTYASRWRVSSRAKMRPENRYVRVVTTSLLLHRVERVDDEVRVTSRYCSVVQDRLGRVRTTLGPAFIASMPEWEEAARVRGPTTGPWEVEIPAHDIVLGAAVAEPGGRLPTDGDDPRVVDSDGDGQPGFTVQVDGFVDGQVYMVQRLARGLRGTLGTDGRMTGLVVGFSEQEVVGASNAILKTFTPRFEHDPDQSRSTFQWVPVASTATCIDVVAAEASMFGED